MAMQGQGCEICKKQCCTSNSDRHAAGKVNPILQEDLSSLQRRTRKQFAFIANESV